VALHSGTLLIGAPLHDSAASNAGAAWIGATTPERLPLVFGDSFACNDCEK
jgi:hypothetical protein